MNCLSLSVSVSPPPADSSASWSEPTVRPSLLPTSVAWHLHGARKTHLTWCRWLKVTKTTSLHVIFLQPLWMWQDGMLKYRIPELSHKEALVKLHLFKSVYFASVQTVQCYDWISIVWYERMISVSPSGPSPADSSSWAASWETTVIPEDWGSWLTSPLGVPSGMMTSPCFCSERGLISCSKWLLWSQLLFLLVHCAFYQTHVGQVNMAFTKNRSLVTLTVINSQSQVYTQSARQPVHHRHTFVTRFIAGI